MKINILEKKVLEAVKQNAEDCSGGDFAIAGDVKVEGLSVSQIKGYLSSLHKKNLIICHGYQRGNCSDVFQITLPGRI